jgi:hypothetical protein
MAADLWLAEIPYRETRDYVRRVLTYRVIYAHKLGLDGFRIGALLRPVAAKTPAPRPDLGAAAGSAGAQGQAEDTGAIQAAAAN